MHALVRDVIGCEKEHHRAADWRHGVGIQLETAHLYNFHFFCTISYSTTR